MAFMSSQQLARRLSVTTTRLSRLLRQQDRGELTLTYRAALASIERRGPLTLGELADVEHIAPPTVTKMVGALGDRGLVERTIDGHDRRVCWVSITDEGRELLAADRRLRTEWLARRLRGLDPADRARLAEAVEVLESLTGQEAQRA